MKLMRINNIDHATTIKYCHISLCEKKKRISSATDHHWYLNNGQDPHQCAKSKACYKMVIPSNFTLNNPITKSWTIPLKLLEVKPSQEMVAIADIG